MVILRVSVEVGQDDKDDTSNPIFSMMTTMKKRLWRIARHPPQPAWIVFVYLNLIHGGKIKKDVKGPIESPSTCNTILSSLLNKLFPDVRISRTRSKINTYGSETSVLKPGNPVL